MVRNDLQFMKNYIDKVNHRFRFLLAAVVILEFALMLRGLCLFNLERLKLRLYLSSYVFLFATSLAMLMFFLIFGQREAHFKKVLAAIYGYTFCFIMWSAGVTCIDLYASGDSGIIVYVLTCVSVGVLVLLKPWIFACYLGVSSLFLVGFTVLIRDGEPYSTGFYLNFAIFLATAIFINNHNYMLSLREYNARRELERLSDTDPLTGLHNRGRLDRQMQKYDGRLPSVLVVMDIDKFKQINDRFGHPEGDACLQRFAQVLTAHFGDRAYRIGGDEFAVLSELSQEEVCAQIDAINLELRSAADAITMQTSAGLYLLRAGDSQEDALRNADRALYRVKQNGGTGWAVYEAGM